MGLFSGIGKFLGNAASGLGKVAQVAAPFLPGPWGAVAGLAGSLIQGGQDQNKANAVTGQMGQAVDQYGQNVRGMLTDPAALYQPALNNIGQNNAALYNQALEASDPSYDAAIAAMNQDMMSRGVGGGAFTGQVRNIRQQQAQNNAGIMRDIGINNTNARTGLFRDIAGAQMQNRMMGMGAEGNILNANLGHLGGLQGMYQSQANQAQQGLGQAIGTLGQSGMYDWFKGQLYGKKGQAGGSTTPGSTASQAPSAVPSWNKGEPVLWGQTSQNPTPSNQQLTGLFKW